MEELISRQAVLDLMQLKMGGKELYKAVYDMPSVTPTHGICKDCKHYYIDEDGCGYHCEKVGYTLDFLYMQISIAKTLKSEVMKMVRELKCPYGDDFEGGDECDRCEQYELCMETYPPANLIEIPKGATNGDMIKAMFPNVKIHQSGGYTSCLFQPSVMLEDTRLDWWNAPYKRGELWTE